MLCSFAEFMRLSKKTHKNLLEFFLPIWLVSFLFVQHIWRKATCFGDARSRDLEAGFCEGTSQLLVQKSKCWQRFVCVCVCVCVCWLGTFPPENDRNHLSGSDVLSDHFCFQIFAEDKIENLMLNNARGEQWKLLRNVISPVFSTAKLKVASFSCSISNTQRKIGDRFHLALFYLNVGQQSRFGGQRTVTVHSSYNPKNVSAVVS